MDKIEDKKALHFGESASMESRAIPVQYDGDYVLTTHGSRDFGEITPKIAKAILRQAGKIRLRIGEQAADSDKGYGEVHINRPSRKKQIQGIGFNNARDFVQYVTSGFDAIYPAGGGALYLHKRGNSDVLLVVKLEPAENGDYYDVKTGYTVRKDFFDKKKPLWGKPQNGITSDEATAQTMQRNASPSAHSGISDEVSIP
jgi:hypothetical protein